MVDIVRHWLLAMSIAKRVSILAGAIGAVMAAIVATASALKIAEPYWVATRAFVRDAVAGSEYKASAAIAAQSAVLDKISRRQVEYQLRSEQAEQRRIEDTIAAKQFLREAATSDALRQSLDTELRRLSSELRDTSAVIDKLERDLGRRP